MFDVLGYNCAMSHKAAREGNDGIYELTCNILAPLPAGSRGSPIPHHEIWRPVCLKNKIKITGSL